VCVKLVAVRTASGLTGGRVYYGKATVYKRETFEFCQQLPRLADDCAVFFVRFNDTVEMSDDELRKLVKMQVRSGALFRFVREKLDEDGPHFCPYFRSAGITWDERRFLDLCESLIGDDKLAPVPVLQSELVPDSDSLKPTAEHLIGAHEAGPCPGGEELPPPPISVETLYVDPTLFANRDVLCCTCIFLFFAWLFQLHEIFTLRRSHPFVSPAHLPTHI
jgi:hypothetical protein